MSKPASKPASDTKPAAAPAATPAAAPAPAPVPAPAAGAVVSVNQELPAGIKVKRAVIVPTLNLSVGIPRYLVIIDPMRESKITDPDPKKAKDKPATICQVGDVTTGEIFVLLVPEVLKGNLEREYPDAGYVGKAFQFTKLPKRPGKRYFDFQCMEIEVDEQTMQAARTKAREAAAAQATAPAGDSAAK